MRTRDKRRLLWTKYGLSYDLVKKMLDEEVEKAYRTKAKGAGR